MTTNLVPTPVLGTWQTGQLISADWLNDNVRDVQKFLAYAPMTIVMRSATQSIANAAQATITFDTEVIDVDGMFSAPSANLTVQRPGVYSIQFEPHFQGNTGGAIRSGHIAINGNWVGSANNAPSAAASALNCSAIVALDAGDVITGMVYQDSGGAILAGGGYNAPRMSVRLISTAQIDVDYTDPQNPVIQPPKPPPSKPPSGSQPVNFTKTYYATWSRSYDGTSTSWDDSALCFQGNESSYRGMTRSLVGFNDAAIRSDLAGATNINVRFTFKCLHSWYNAGMTVVVGAHKYTSKPGSWSAANVSYDQKRAGSIKAGQTATVYFGVNNWEGWAFQTGAIRGMAFGPGPDTSLTYYGYMAGATQGGKPYLTISYTK